jgi:hypothetical protein
MFSLVLSWPPPSSSSSLPVFSFQLHPLSHVAGELADLVATNVVLVDHHV